ncbi:MAG: hypothetical protein R3345_15925, partial [Fulvivirga sp.]|nr:hypothetical protein [Fulvivirga sp.]
MKKLLIIIFTVSFAGFGFAQQDNSVEYANTITESDMYAHLSVLASDALQGRETGKAGQKMAAAYLAEKFKQLGLKGPVKEGRNFGFYQDVVLYSKQPGDIFLQQGNEKYSNFDEVIYFGQDTHIPKSYHRFQGLMEKLFSEKSIQSYDQTLLEIQKKSFSDLIDEI